MKKQKHGFSLIEISVVLLIIGIFIAGIFASNVFITKARIAAAQTLLRSSPIRDIKDNALWLETSSLDSFADSEASDGTALTAWYEARSATSKVTLTAVNGGPTYSNTINRIHAVKFVGTGYFTFDGSFLNNTDYTITILEKREASGGNNYFLGDSAITTTNQSLLLGYSTDGEIIHSQGASSSYPGLVSSYSSSSGNPRVLTFTHSSSAGKKLYINGVLAAKDEANLAPLTGIGTLSFGKGYKGQIGELAIFTRALRAEEIKSVEGYMAQKFNSRLVANDSTDCLGKLVTTSSCEVASTCDVSVTGVSSTTPVASGSGILTCDATGYTGTSAYTCTSGTLSAAPCALAATPVCTGTVAADTSTVSGYAIHKFTSSGTLTCSTSKTIWLLVVAGGGGGGSGAHGAGGGAGGVIEMTSYSLPAGTSTITVGDGGAFDTSGDNSVFTNPSSATITAIGGGCGGKYGVGSGATAQDGCSGGSGGGASISGPGWPWGHVGTGTAGQGNSGATGPNTGPAYGGGGGGGAGEAGYPGTGSNGGAGGMGISSSIMGSSNFYGGGGGGSSYNGGTGSAGAGGLGGGGAGGSGSNGSEAAGSGVANTGGGGGGTSGGYGSLIGGSGGSGVVIVRYEL